jgi:hypothetical protein
MPEGMTERKARAKARATTEVLRSAQDDGVWGRAEKKKQIPVENDRKKDKGKNGRKQVLRSAQNDNFS